MSDANFDTEPVESIGILNKLKIGEKTGHVAIPFTLGNNTIFDLLNTGYYHVHGEALTYPLLANPVLLTAAAGAWGNTGTIVEIIPAGVTNRAFDLHWAQVSDISVAYYGIVELFKGAAGAEIKITDFPIFRTNNFISEGNMRIQIPQQIAGQRISARLSDSTAGQGTCRIKLLGHYYG